MFAREGLEGAAADAAIGESPLLQRRQPGSPRTPPYAAAGLDGSTEAANGGNSRKYVDYKMEAAPAWDGEHPEQQYKEYARNLKLWLIEAQERLPGNLIGKRILDVIPYGSRLAALMSHLSVDEVIENKDRP